MASAPDSVSLITGLDFASLGFSGCGKVLIHGAKPKCVSRSSILSAGPRIALLPAFDVIVAWLNKWQAVLYEV